MENVLQYKNNATEAESNGDWIEAINWWIKAAELGDSESKLQCVIICSMLSDSMLINNEDAEYEAKILLDEAIRWHENLRNDDDYIADSDIECTFAKACFMFSVMTEDAELALKYKYQTFETLMSFAANMKEAPVERLMWALSARFVQDKTDAEVNSDLSEIARTILLDSVFDYESEIREHLIGEYLYIRACEVCGLLLIEEDGDPESVDLAYSVFCRGEKLGSEVCSEIVSKFRTDKNGKKYIGIL